MTTQSQLAALDAAARQSMDRAMHLADTSDDHAQISSAMADNAVLHDRLAAKLVNLYRANKLVLVPSVEEVALVIRDVTGGVNYDYMDFCRDAAKAVLASMGAKTDGQ